MKAIIIDQYGDANELHKGELTKPTVAPDEVLVQLKNTSINPIDWKARLGMLKGMFDWQMPVVLGWDLSGIISEVGADVTQFHVGDEILARPDIYQDGIKGTYAEFAVVKEDKLALKPTKVSFKEAAALPLAGLTAWQVVVDRLKIQPGEKIFIEAGAGGVGLFAIQIAKHFGAYVATTASAANADLLTSLGADEVIDYHSSNYEEVLHDFDAAFDSRDELDKALKILKPEGRLVTIDGKITDAMKSASQDVSSWWLQPNGKELTELVNLVADGTIKVLIDSEFTLTTEGLRQAHEKSQSGHARGKIVINVAE